MREPHHPQSVPYAASYAAPAPYPAPYAAPYTDGADRDDARMPVPRRLNQPVFMERHGRRRRLLRWAALFVGLACAGYIAAFLFAMAGALHEPGGEKPPQLGEQQRSAPDSSGLSPGDAPVRSADAQAL